jgi:hypothetical protein
VFPTHVAGDTYTNLVAPGQGIATPVNLPESGDPVLCGSIVGVVNNDALTAADLVVISTRGVYGLAVQGKTTSGANLAVAAGDKVFIDPATAVLTADSTKVPFGEALGAVNAGATTVIPVKLYPSTSPQNQSGSAGNIEVDANSGAIGILQGNVFITKAGVAAMTLAAPTAGVDDNKVLTIVSTTANAHTVTTPANKINGNKLTITFGAVAGNQVELLAFNGTWFVRNPATADGYTLA